MSFFGKNIKKIRTIKGLSQSAFADIFNLKRATLGAYEEHRSEPKIDTIIKIANYFSIKIDTLLTSDITVNELLQFKENLATYSEVIKKDLCTKIPLITDSNTTDYLTHFENKIFIDEMPCIRLPLDNSKKFRALSISNLEMTNKDKGFYPKDIVIGEQIPLDTLQKLTNGTLVFIVIDNQIIFRRIYITNKNIILRAEHKNIDDKTFKISNIKELWAVQCVFCKRIPDFSSSFEDKITNIEQEILKMKAKIN